MLPGDYGDLAAECRALYEHSVAFDLSAFGRIALSGGDAGIVVRNMLANDTGRLEDGGWMWGIMCDACGRLADIVRVGQTGESYLVLTSPGARQRIIDIIKECAAQSGCAGVKIADQTEKTGMLGIYGPGAIAALDHILPMGVSDMEPGEIRSFSVFMMSVTLVRGSWLGVDGIELVSGAAACKLAAGAIEKYHKRENITPGGMECLEIALIEASLPLVLTEQAAPERLGPGAYGLGRLIDDKKDYFGKNCTATASRAAVGLKMQGKAHTHKDLRIQHDGREIGWTDRIVWSEKLGATIGVGMVDAGMGDADEVQVTGDGVAMGAEIVALPFEKTLAAGIYKNFGF
jgi:aminomethyltransferase